MKNITMKNPIGMIATIAAIALATTTPGFADITVTGDVNPADPATWTSSTLLQVGSAVNGTGSVTIDSGSMASISRVMLGFAGGANGTLVVDGNDSSLTMSSSFTVGFRGPATLYVTDGASISNTSAIVGQGSGGTAESAATVRGTDSVWTSTDSLIVGNYSFGELLITAGGLVKTASLSIDAQVDNDSYINISNDGMLALSGTANTLGEFLGLIETNADSLNVWSTTANEWVGINDAVMGQDYTLSLGTDDLDGYTVLTAVPEPGALTLLGLGALAAIRRRKA